MLGLRVIIKSAILVFITFGILACGSEPEIKNDYSYIKHLPAKAHDAYARGDGILLFSFRKNIQDSEAYADWAEYLNNFNSTSNSDIVIFEASKGFITSLNITSPEFSIFLKKGQQRYFYDGLIVEPQVYTAVYRKYSGEDLSNIDRSFLPQTFCQSQLSSLVLTKNCVED